MIRTYIAQQEAQRAQFLVEKAKQERQEKVVKEKLKLQNWYPLYTYYPYTCIIVFSLTPTSPWSCYEKWTCIKGVITVIITCYSNCMVTITCEIIEIFDLYELWEPMMSEINLSCYTENLMH